MPLAQYDFDYWDGIPGQVVVVTLYDAAHAPVAPSPYALAELAGAGRYVGSAGALPAGIYRSETTAGGVVVDRQTFRWDGVEERDITAGAVWDELTAAHAIPGSLGEAVASTTPADIADAVWDEATSGHIAAGSFGEALGFQLETTLFWRLLTTTYSGTPSRPTYMLAAAYPSKADADADINRRYTVQIDQTFNASGDLLTSKRTRI